MPKPDLIAVDWGTSNFRAFLLNHEGNTLETRFAKRGLLHVPRGDFAAALTLQIGDYLQANPKVPIVMSGMVGSRQGWQEVPYLNCPADLGSLANKLQRVDGQMNAWIAPGVRMDYPDGRVDVMRGEETQILGCLSETEVAAETPQVFCLPGTHSKWAWVESGKLTRFTTFMTGEIFNLLFKYSILGKPMQHAHLSMQAFHQGLAWSKRPEHILSQLFQVRTQMLAGKLPAEDIHNFLSGILIGHELSAVLGENGYLPPSQKIFIVANARIAQLYAKALATYQAQAIVKNISQVTVAGIFKVAQQAGLIG